MIAARATTARRFAHDHLGKDRGIPDGARARRHDDKCDVDAHDPPLLALTTTPLGASPDSGTGPPALRLVLRLGTIDPRPVVAGLAAAGLLVERPVAWSSPAQRPAGAAVGGR
jgi:hypothetical protein